MEWWWTDCRGTIPTEFGKLTKLDGMAINRNLLTGTLPPELAHSGVKQVFAEHNDFEVSLTGWLFRDSRTYDSNAKT